MSLLSRSLLVCAIPHLTSRLDPGRKAMLRENYAKVKKGIGIVSLSTVASFEGYELAKDVLSSQLKAHGYRTFFGIIMAPVLQLVSVPLYIFSYGNRLRKVALVVAETGDLIGRGEFTLYNAFWIVSDLVLFGEVVPIVNPNATHILGNETVGNINSVVNDITFSNG